MNVVTGAFGYIGKYITRHLLDSGEQVKTVTTHPDKPNPFGNSVKAFPFNFDKPDELTAALRGATTLYNTYWVRIEHGGATFQRAVENTVTLFECARRAGVQKIVHISVTQVSEHSRLPYYRGKAAQEKALVASGVPYAIVRPTLVFGIEDILVNNIAWMMRTFPVFPVFGSGQYRLQPVFVEDLASIAVSRAKDAESCVVDAIGPETYTFSEFVTLMVARIRPSVRLAHVPPSVGIALGKVIGLATRDVVLTTDELRGLMDSLLTSTQAPNGTTRFSQWLEANKERIGASYTSELARHFRWKPA